VNDLSTLQFILLAVAFVSGVMIGLQATIRKGVWGFYLLAFFASSIGFAATVLLR
jgi:uncharacterized membrane protein YjjP (DUF1212 family)